MVVDLQVSVILLTEQHCLQLPVYYVYLDVIRCFLVIIVKQYPCRSTVKKKIAEYIDIQAPHLV